MDRRDFVRTAAVTAASSGPFLGRILGANDRILAGQIGAGGRGTYEMQVSKRLSGVQTVAVADVYPPLVNKAVDLLGHGAKGYKDFRDILDRKDIDVVFVSTPDHWHAPASILAMQAGKDVYCEKPLTHNIREGQVLVKIARRQDRVFQTGSQQRSAPHFQKIVQLIRSGHIGKVSLIDCWNTQNMSPRGYGNPPDSDPPTGLDWDLFLGPAPKVSYNRNRYHFNYRWFWDYSGGMMTDWGAHHIDVVHWAMDVNAPTAAIACGGKFCSEDNTETPDTLTTLFEYPGFIARYSLRNGNARQVESRPYGMSFHGTKGTLVVDRSGYEVIPEIVAENRPSDFDRLDAFLKGGESAAYTGFYQDNPAYAPRCEPLKETGIKMEPGVQEAHVQNFLECVRSRERPAADVEIGHRSVSACHIGVIAYRLGSILMWDAAREQFIGDEQAQAMTSRKYRKPWTLPEV
jgi:predicted dehydrogenase